MCAYCIYIMYVYMYYILRVCTLCWRGVPVFNLHTVYIHYIYIYIYIYIYTYIYVYINIYTISIDAAMEGSSIGEVLGICCTYIHILYVPADTM
jgi:hypothetical protein